MATPCTVMQIIITDITAAVNLPSGKNFNFSFTLHRKRDNHPICPNLTLSKVQQLDKHQPLRMKSFYYQLLLNMSLFCLTDSHRLSLLCVQVARNPNKKDNTTTKWRARVSNDVLWHSHCPSYIDFLIWKLCAPVSLPLVWCPSCRFLGFNMVLKCFDKPRDKPPPHAAHLQLQKQDYGRKKNKQICKLR